jgi:hypothetical protein
MASDGHRPTSTTTATLPPRENSPQYRIRNDEERPERVTTQGSLNRCAYRQPVKIQRSKKGRSEMAKGQKRSNREIRKPKQEKAPPASESTFGNQIKFAASANTPRAKGRP